MSNAPLEVRFAPPQDIDHIELSATETGHKSQTDPGSCAMNPEGCSFRWNGRRPVCDFQGDFGTCLGTFPRARRLWGQQLQPIAGFCQGLCSEVTAEARKFDRQGERYRSPTLGRGYSGTEHAVGSSGIIRWQTSSPPAGFEPLG